MTNDELDAIEARARAIHEGDGDNMEWDTVGVLQIVHDDIPALVAEVRRLRRDNAEFLWQLRTVRVRNTAGGNE